MGRLVATSARISSNAAARYGVAFCAVVLALGVRGALNPVFGDYLPYVTLYPAVALAAWCCGVGPSALVTLVGIVGARYLFLSPKYTLSIPDSPQVVGALAFAVGAAAIAAIGELVRRDSATLHRAQSDLEEKVQQRTAELNDANHSLGELSARLLAQLGAAALVELTAFVALANLYSRTNTALGVESQGFSAACELRPLAVRSSA